MFPEELECPHPKPVHISGVTRIGPTWHTPLALRKGGYKRCVCCDGQANQATPLHRRLCSQDPRSGANNPSLPPLGEGGAGDWGW